MRRGLLLVTVFVLGCGTAQYAAGPEEEALTGGRSAPHQPTQAESSWCHPPPDFPPEIMLVTEDLCWIELDATQEECARIKAKERWPYMLYGGRCWFLQAKKPERQPTSSLLPDIGR